MDTVSAHMEWAEFYLDILDFTLSLGWNLE